MISRKFPLKITLDIIMLFLLTLMYQKRVISMAFHEWGGLTVFCLFIIHIAFNWKWVVSVTSKVFRKTMDIKIKIRWIVNLLLFISLLIIIITGIMMNRTLPFSLGEFWGIQVWHYFFAALFIIFTGIHLGLHWSLVIGILKKRLFFSKPAVKIIGMIALVAILIGGSFFMVTGHFGMWIAGPFETFDSEDFPQHGKGDKDFEVMRDKFDKEESQEIYGATDNEMGEFPFDEDKSPEFRHGNRGKHRNPSVIGAFIVILTYVSQIIVFSFITVMLSKILSDKRAKTQNPIA